MAPDPLLELDRDPLVQLRAWLGEAVAAGLREPTAMALATVSPDGSPEVRVVLMRGLDEHGLTFYTNYESAKGVAMAAHPRAAVVFFWDPLERQVRVSGAVERVPPEDSEAYFLTRPVGSRLAAWASDQSRPIADRAALEARFAAAAARYPDDDVPLPPWWGGYRIVPDRYEFWLGRRDRMHDRLLYTPDHRGGWRRGRLMP